MQGQGLAGRETTKQATSGSRTFGKLVVVYLRSSFKPNCIQDDTLLVVREHVASLKPLLEAVTVAAIPLADLAVHLHTT